MSYKKNLKKYAKLILEVGINLQKGQKISINASVNNIDLVRQITKYAYKMGAKDILINYYDEKIIKNKINYGSDDAIGYFSDSYAEFLEKLIDEEYHRISITDDSPEAFKDVDGLKLQKMLKKSREKTKTLMDKVMRNEVKWLVVAYASKDWAKSVFPSLTKKKAVKKLWKNIFKACRVDKDNPKEAWLEHDKNLKKRQKFLNESDFVKFKYLSKGTSLEVYLAQNHVWIGGSSKSKSGEIFFPNIPTEEIFSMPHAYKVNGVLSSTKPLYYNGNIIDNMKFTFKDGAVVDYSAEIGKETLDALLSVDEGAKRLGEIALVEHNSPISNTNILFKNTLFDENASCHFAFGKAYYDNIDTELELNDENKKKLGVNDSLIHVDFMIGDENLEIIATDKNGKETLIFKNGNWIINS